MTNFVWTAKDKAGTTIVREVPAETVAQSKAILLAQGVTDVALIEEEVAQAACAPLNKPTMFLGEDLNAKVTPPDRLKYRSMRFTYFGTLLEGIKQTKLIVLFFVGVLGWFVYRQSWVAASLAAIGLLAWLAVMPTLSLPVILLRKLTEAADWNRWNEVLLFVTRLQKLNRIHFLKVPKPELARFRAQALAASGHLDQALTEYKKFEDAEGCPEWLYKSHVASIYQTIGDYDKA